MCFSDTVKGRHGLRDDIAEIRQRRFFVDKGKYEDEKKRKEKNISCKKISSVYGKKFLSIKCLIFEISNL